MPPAFQTTSRNQCAPIFLRAERYLKGGGLASEPDRTEKEIPCAVKGAAGRIADAAAERLRKLGRRGGVELRCVFRYLAAFLFLLPKALG